MKRIICVFVALLMLLSALPCGAEMEIKNTVPDDAFEGGNSEYKNRDGSVTTVFDNGDVFTVYKDGSGEGVDYLGNRHTVDKDGTLRIYGIDGSVTESRTDGTKDITLKDGGKYVINPDGTVKKTYANGLCMEEDADGKTTCAYFEGSTEKVMAVDGELPDCELNGPNGEKLICNDSRFYVKGRNGVEYDQSILEDGKTYASLKTADGGSAVINDEGIKYRFKNGEELFVSSDGRATASDGSYVYVDPNSQAYEMYDAETGDYVKVNEKGELTDFNRKIGNDSVVIKDGKIESFVDTKAGIEISHSDDGKTLVKTKEGTYSVDKNGKVLKDGKPLVKSDSAAGEFEDPGDVFGYYQVYNGQTLQSGNWWELGEAFRFENTSLAECGFIYEAMEDSDFNYSLPAGSNQVEVKIDSFVVYTDASKNKDIHVTGKKEISFTCPTSNRWREAGDSISISYSFDLTFKNVKTRGGMIFVEYDIEGTETCSYSTSTKNDGSKSNTLKKTISGTHENYYSEIYNPVNELSYITLRAEDIKLNPSLTGVKRIPGKKQRT